MKSRWIALSTFLQAQVISTDLFVIFVPGAVLQMIANVVAMEIQGLTVSGDGSLSSDTDAQIFGLLDPRLCYILDGLLFIYAVIVTALFFREKLTQKIPEPVGYRDNNYDELNPSGQSKYDALNVRREEKAARRQKPSEIDSTYTGLQRDEMSDHYSDIRPKQPQKRQGKKHDPVYQGLHSGFQDTYDALHMQPLPPLP